MTFKKFLNIFIGLCLLAGLGMGGYVYYLASNLPKIITVEDYKPLVVSKVYAKDGQEIGEFFREKRIVVPYEKIPKHVVHAFLAAEDSSFFEHGGINLQAIFRAVIANIKAGRKVQGGSTITQQVAKSLMLTPEKTYTRKIKEAFLALQMEEKLTKEEILYLYLNKVYFIIDRYTSKPIHKKNTPIPINSFLSILLDIFKVYKRNEDLKNFIMRFDGLTVLYFPVHLKNEIS